MATPATASPSTRRAARAIPAPQRGTVPHAEGPEASLPMVALMHTGTLTGMRAIARAEAREPAAA
jgi:hypothetical protein